MYKVGEVVKPREGETPLGMEHYQVSVVQDTSVRLIAMRPKLPKDGAQVTRTIFVPRELMKRFDRVSD